MRTRRGPERSGAAGPGGGWVPRRVFPRAAASRGRAGAGGRAAEGAAGRRRGWGGPAAAGPGDAARSAVCSAPRPSCSAARRRGLLLFTDCAASSPPAPASPRPLPPSLPLPPPLRGVRRRAARPRRRNTGVLGSGCTRRGDRGRAGFARPLGERRSPRPAGECTPRRRQRRDLLRGLGEGPGAVGRHRGGPGRLLKWGMRVSRAGLGTGLVGGLRCLTCAGCVCKRKIGKVALKVD